jgi:Predicted sugar kinase
MSMSEGRALIIANAAKAGAEISAQAIAARLASIGCSSDTFLYRGDPDGPPEAVKRARLVISLGGDGTALYAARVAAPHGVPVLPINLGHLGFIAEIGSSDWPEAIDAWAAGRLPVSERLMLFVEAWRGEKSVASYWAMNDATISAQGIAKLIGFGMGVGGSSLVRYRADGAIVATPTGSTAYNLAAGGPVLNPEMEALIVNPICPFTLSNRPLVVRSDEAVELSIEEGQRAGVMLTIDGQETFPLRGGDRIVARGAPRKALFYVSERFEFYSLLRSKLAWNSGPGGGAVGGPDA